MRPRLAAGTALVLLTVAISVSRPHAQAPAQAPDPNASYVYEAASVKPNKTAPQGSSIRRFPGGRLQATNMPLRALITFAYQLQPFQLVGDPGWLRTETFDIVAKMEGDPPAVMPGQGPDPHMVAMRTLLADRFKLTVHRETREMDIYALVIARPDGKPGPALKLSTQDCEAMLDAAKRGKLPPPPGPNDPVICGTRGNPGRIQVGGMPLVTFANLLSGRRSHRPCWRVGLRDQLRARVSADCGASRRRAPAWRPDGTIALHCDSGAAGTSAAVNKGTSRSARRRSD